ncbi:MAG TPA: lipoprotein-releasing ABC transporter permease subunit [Steroidobacteraceae bacterium]|jgi:lipoprotein-releasing system permease protein
MFQPLPLFVGLRYSFARKHSFFVSFITWVSLIGVAVGVWALIVILSVMNGLEGDIRGRLVSLSAHAVLTAGGGGAIPDWQDAIAKLKGSPELTGLAPDLDTDAMLKGEGSMSGAVVRGVDPAAEPSVSTIGEAMRNGKLTDLTPGSNRIILGRELAEQLQVEPGDSLTVMIAGGSADKPDTFVPRLQDFQVVGIFEVGIQEQDGVLALINLKDAEALRGLSGPTSIRLKFDDVLRAPRLAQEAAQRLAAGLTVRDWTEENQAYFRAIRIEKTMMGILLLLVVAVAAFNIVATLVMVVNDKRTDIAILRTLGLTPREVIAVFMTQGALIGWIGTSLGVILGIITALNAGAISELMASFGLYIFDPSVFYMSGIPSEMHAGDVVRIACAAFLLSLAATVYPALQAARTQPAEALRYE